MSILERALLAAHLFSAAGWFGALVYRTFFVDPKAKNFFARGQEFSAFSLHLADGMRYVVMLALLTSGLSGFALLGLRWSGDPDWQMRMLTKGAIWLLAFGLFGYISWVYWPKRLFATAQEERGLRRQGLALSLTMIALAGLGMLLGQWGKG